MSIGIDKGSSIGVVFSHYWDVANDMKSLAEDNVEQENLEFLHVTLLTGQETPEAAALMKNDTIRVQRSRNKERTAKMELNKVFRELDREFFSQMCMNLYDGDTVLDCIGKQQEDDKVQQFLSTRVRCYAAIVNKRCPWLAEKIRSGGDVVQIEHPPHAVSLLLEYCYSNRVISLGYEAFVRSCRTKPEPKKGLGPVPPYPTQRKWPQKGNPTVSFAQAKAALQLAEEAKLSRLSLMCEVAASQLVNPSNVVDSLVLCQSQKECTQNPLPILRKEAMLVLLSNFSLVQNSVKEQKKFLVPTLLSGTVEVVDPKKGPQEDWRLAALGEFGSHDESDKLLRQQERRKRREERGDLGAKRDSDAFDSMNEYDVRPLKKMKGHDLRWALK